MTNQEIKELFLRNGFTIKENQEDLKPYVYAAAKELIDATRAEIVNLIQSETVGDEVFVAEILDVIQDLRDGK